MLSTGHFADRLCAAIEAKGTPACVGLDPVLSKLPNEARGDVDPGHPSRHMAAREAVRGFCEGIIGCVAPLVPAIKINSAFFEALGPEGLGLYFEVIGSAVDAGFIVIGDIKRGDIGHSTEAYAEGHLSAVNPMRGGGKIAPDAVTVSSYLGLDGLNPFLRVCIQDGKGVFALVQTSNQSAAEIQDARLASGDTVAIHVARLVNRWAGEPESMGRSGYSALGAVVSPRDRESTRALRSIMDHCVFLVPGFGAQGKPADEIAECFKPDGTGAIVNASRSVIYAFDDPRYASSGKSWQSCVEAACRDFVCQINDVARGI